MTPIRIVVADDHVFYREGIKAMLVARGTDEVVVVGEAGTRDGAVRQAAALTHWGTLKAAHASASPGVPSLRPLASQEPSAATLTGPSLPDEMGIVVVTWIRGGGMRLPDRHQFDDGCLFDG